MAGIEEVAIYVDDKVDQTIQKLHDKVKEEFGWYLIANKNDLFHIVDMHVPEQTVTSASVEIKGMEERYDKVFTDQWNKNDEFVIVGTGHSHNTMSAFFSTTDDTDLANTCPVNFNENLPFIDIVWSAKDGYKGRVAMKTKFNGQKKIFVYEDAEIVIVDANPASAAELKAAEEVISRWAKTAADVLQKKLGNNYVVNEEALAEAITFEPARPEMVIELDQYLDKIKKTYYKSTYYNGKYDGEWDFPKGKIGELMGSGVSFCQNKSTHELEVTIFGDTGFEFKQDLECLYGVDQMAKGITCKESSFKTSKDQYTVTISIDVDMSKVDEDLKHIKQKNIYKNVMKELKRLIRDSWQYFETAVLEPNEDDYESGCPAAEAFDPEDDDSDKRMFEGISSYDVY